MTATVIGSSEERHTGETLCSVDLAHLDVGAVQPSPGTAVQLSALPNTVLRGVLENWDATLSPSISSWAPLQTIAAVNQVITGSLAEFVGRRVSWLFYGSPDSVESVQEVPEETRQPSAVEAVDRIVEIFGLPVRDILTAAGIARRTYYSWRGQDVSPRLASLGRLWQLLQVGEDLQKIISGDVASWVAADPARRQTLLSGKFDLLMGEFLNERARAGWYRKDAGSVDWMEGAGREDVDLPVVKPRRLQTTSAPQVGTIGRIRRAGKDSAVPEK